jgi:hypothetical protein
MTLNLHCIFSFWYNGVQLGSQFCLKLQLGSSIHLKPFSVCSCQVASLFYFIFQILKENDHFRKNLKIELQHMNQNQNSNQHKFEHNPQIKHLMFK